MSIPKSEYPRPQFRRDGWKCLNGSWDVGMTHSAPGRTYYEPFPDTLPDIKFDRKILVPFCPESQLSGTNNKEFISSMAYRREIEIPADWKDQKIILNCGAIYYKCAVYIDGKIAGRHIGGSVSFSVDLTDFVITGKKHNLTIICKTKLQDGVQGGGKQSQIYNSHGCYYTRTTGIWQTVWLEAANKCALKNLYMVSDITSGTLVITPQYYSTGPDQRIKVFLSDNGKDITSLEKNAVEGVPLIVQIPDPVLWSPENPHLYDLRFEITDSGNNVIDTVKSYQGLREVRTEGNRFLLNGKPYYQRLVLDQGFYPDGIWTSPDDSALKKDIELAKNAGFNGARLHQKIFEPRFFYWADKLGYLCWGETPSWGFDPNNEGLGHMNFLSELREEIVRDRNHPSIVAWTPLNETRDIGIREHHERIHRSCYDLCKSTDPSRPVNDASGYIHYMTDLFTVHLYEQNPENFEKKLHPDKEGHPFQNYPGQEADYSGQPYLIDEFGGIKWDEEHMSLQSSEDFSKKNRWESWGYGRDVRTLDEFYSRLNNLVNAVLSLKHICGYCYTQLTDVEQEKNGIYSYDRQEKFDMDKIRAIFSKTQEDN